MPVLYVRICPTLRELLPLEILPECLIDDLSVGEAIEVGLASDGLNPALFDMEGGAPAWAGIARLVQGRFTLLPPAHEFLKIVYHRDKHLTVHLGYAFGGHVG